MSDLVKLLQSLVDSGQLGIIIVMSVIALGAAIAFIWGQKQAVSQFKQHMELLEKTYKATNELQEKSIVELERQRNERERANSILQLEIEKLQNNQESFEADVRSAMTAGVIEIKKTLEEITVRELIEQIPESFRQDLHNEMQLAAQATGASLVKQFEALQEAIDKPEFKQAVASKVAEALVGQFARRFQAPKSEVE